jgi:hypothetical protein
MRRRMFINPWALGLPSGWDSLALKQHRSHREQQTYLNMIILRLYKCRMPCMGRTVPPFG